MLRQEQTQEQSFVAQPPIYGTSPTAQGADARVSPDELVAAISAIEAQRSENERWQADTVALGDAVQQLGLNITPDELMAEIEKARSQQFTDVRIKAGRVQQRRSIVAVLAVFTLLFAIPIALFFLTFAARQAPEPVTYSATGNGVTAVREVPFEATQPKATNLSTLQDNVEAFTTLGSVFEFNRGKSPTEITLNSTQELDNTFSGPHRWQWTFVKHNGEPYLKGWAAKQKDGTFTRIYSTQPEKLDVLSPVTIRLAALKNVRDPSGTIQERREPGFTLNTIEYLDLTKSQIEAIR